MAPLSSVQKALAALILLIIVFFSLFRITESPPFGLDEGWAVQVATNISRSGADGLQFAPGDIRHVSVITSIGYPLTYALAFWFKLFGPGILEARVMMAAYMIGFAAVAFIFLRRSYGNSVALAGGALLATFPPFYTFGKAVIGEVPVMFFLALFFLFFHLATTSRERRHFWFILAGASAGLCIVTKTMALAFVPVLVVGAFLARKKGLATWKDIGIVAVSALVPFAVWIGVNFQAGDTLASVLDYYTNPSVLDDRSATFWLNVKKFFTEMGAIYVLLLMVSWVAGILVRLRAGTKIRVEESMALIFSLLLIASFLGRYGDARYLFPIQAIGIIFFPYSIYCIMQALPWRADARSRDRIFALSFAILAALGLYQLSFRSYVADWYASHYQAGLAEYFSAISATTTVFFYNSPHFVPLFKGSDYYQRLVMFDKWVLGSDFLPIVADRRADLLVLSPRMLKDEEKPAYEGYEEVARFKKTFIFRKTGDPQDRPGDK